MNPECPSCHRPIANRRRPVCLYCGGAIPEEMLFTPEEAAAVDKEMADLELQRQRRKGKEEEERREAARRAGGDVDLSGFYNGGGAG